MSRNNPASWGLMVPGRPPTPSEGYAQQYDRIGPVESQKLWTFDNGTCLTYGPDDLVDEFDPVMHPFCNQIALIDTLVRECKTIRARYESTAQLRVNNSDSSASDKQAVEDDPFNDFRTVLLDPQTLPQIALDSGVYLQTPSRYASVSNLVSVYSSTNKSDVPGEAHKGATNDTRFGMCGKPVFGSLQQHIQRQDNIHKLKALPLEQEGAEKHRGRRFRKFDNDRQHFQGSNSRGRGPARGSYGQPTNGRRNQPGTNNRRPTHFQHQRFKSQDEASQVSTPFTTVSFPILDSDQNVLPPDYEDEGPLLYTPAPLRYQRQRYQGSNFVQQASSILGSSRAISPIESDTESTEAVRRARSYSIQRAFSEDMLGNQSQDFIPLGAIVQNEYVPNLAEDVNSNPTSRGIQHSYASAGAQSRNLLAYNDASEGGSVFSTVRISTPRASLSRTEGNKKVVGLKPRAEIHDSDEQSQLYARYLDDMNKRSTSQGDKVLEGDMKNNEPGIAVHPPTPAHSIMERLRTISTSPGSRESENDEWQAVKNKVQASHVKPGAHARSNMFDVIQAANRRAAHGLSSSTRGLSPAGSGSDSGHLSEPSRNRPVLLSPFQFAPMALPSGDNVIFGERAGSVSREPSPDGGRSRGPRRRLYEQ